MDDRSDKEVGGHSGLAHIMFMYKINQKRLGSGGMSIYASRIRALTPRSGSRKWSQDSINLERMEKSVFRKSTFLSQGLSVKLGLDCLGNEF